MLVQEAGGLWALTYRFNVTDTTFEVRVDTQAHT